MSGDTFSLEKALQPIAPRGFQGTAYRFIGTRFANTALSSAGSLTRGGRFNPPNCFEALYTALAAETAIAERDGLLLTASGVRLADRVGTGVLLRMECRLTAVLDLRDDILRRRLRMSLAVLLGPWLAWNAAAPVDSDRQRPVTAPTQELGLALYNSKRFEALLAPSAKDAAGTCLVIFPGRLRPRSRVKVDDPRGSIHATLGLTNPSVSGG